MPAKCQFRLHYSPRAPSIVKEFYSSITLPLCFYWLLQQQDASFAVLSFHSYSGSPSISLICVKMAENSYQENTGSVLL